MTRLALFISKMLLAFLAACTVLPSTIVPPSSLPNKDTILTLAEAGVSSNSKWTPFIEEHNKVLMALVPSGCFTMGITQDQIDYAKKWINYGTAQSLFSDQQPAHQVCFETPFWIDVHEVTQAQFAEFDAQATNPSHFTGGTLPREQISWTEANAFCATRGARLPTEAEWEYASRGPDGLLFPWGNTFECSRGNFDDETDIDDTHVIEGFPNCDGFPATAPVGKIKEGASWVGALDLSGNVWEWVADWYDATYYDTLAMGVVNPQGPTDGKFRALRGGAWSIDEPDHLLVTFRGWYDPDTVGDISLIGKHLGFRCALSYH